MDAATSNRPVDAAFRRWWAEYSGTWSRAHLWLVIGGAALGLIYLLMVTFFGEKVANDSGVEDLVEDLMGTSNALIVIAFLGAAGFASLNVMVPWKPLDRAFVWLDGWLMKATIQMISVLLGFGLVAGLHYAIKRTGLGNAVALLTALFALMLTSTNLLLTLIRSFSDQPKGRWMAFLMLITVVIFAVWTLRQQLGG